MTSSLNLGESLAEEVEEGVLWETLDDRRIRCVACGHRCPIFEGQCGVCKVRFNNGGKLYVPWGYVQSLQRDPIEKKPFFHVQPGASTLSFGMLGCDLHCGYCQNWVSSQTIRDARAVTSWRRVTPDDIAGAAEASEASAVISTYNEPLITAEWAVSVFRSAKARGLITGFVSNGNATPEVLEYLRPWVDVFKVDLKSFDDGHYRQLGGRLAPILESLRRIHEMGYWLEVVTLVVPGFNDSDQELRGMADFLASVSADIPWHVSAFHPDYKMTSPRPTPYATIRRAVAIGREAGLRFVYAGNLLFGGEGLENTNCPNCGRCLVRRSGFRVLANLVTANGGCPSCATRIPGVWS